MRNCIQRKEHSMTISLLILTSATATISATFAILVFYRMNGLASGGAPEQLRVMLHGEVDRILQFGDGQSRGLREELGGTMRGFQTVRSKRSASSATRLRPE